MRRVDEFWSFVIEREQIRLNRLVGLPREEWTTDPIMRQYSFTNVKRDHDRTTTLLDREFYDPLDLSHPDPVALINAAIFRYHGTIEMARAIGWTSDWNAEVGRRIEGLGETRMLGGETVFTSAYMIPNCGSTASKPTIVRQIMSEIWDRREDVLATESWRDATDQLCRCWGVGSFMAKEILLDYVLATGWKPSDWMTWTPVGPGGRRGAGVVKYDEIRGISEAEALEVIREVYATTEERWPESFYAGGYEFVGVELDLTDIQFQFCEFAKYMKAKTGVGKPKRLFRPTEDNMTRGDL